MLLAKGAVTQAIMALCLVRIYMRKAALCAGIAYLLFGTYAAKPELFGARYMPGPNQFLDLATRSFALVGSYIYAIFFFIVYRNAAALNPFGAVRLASVIAAAALTIENLLPAYRMIGNLVTAANAPLSWKYHPFQHLAYMLVPAIPKLPAISLAVFLFLVFSASRKTPGHAPDGTGGGSPLSWISFAAAAAVSFIGLAWLFYSAVTAPRLPSPFWLLLRVVATVSLVAFFFSLGVNQRSGPLRTRQIMMNE